MLASILSLAVAGPVRDIPFDVPSFRRFAEMRAGNGQPVFWYCEGEVYRLPDGELIARMDGVDSARRLPDLSDGTVVQASRKVFRYLDPQSGEELRKVNGQDLKRIEYPYQLIRYQLKNGRMVASVEQGSGARLQTVSAEKARRREVNGAEVFSIPLFVSVKTPNRTINAYENYDFFTERSRPARLTWNRVGDLPPAFGAGQCVIQLVATRYERFSDLPAALRKFIEQEAPLWKQPPVDDAEIRRLQQ